VNESMIDIIVCVSFVNLIPKLSGGMDLVIRVVGLLVLLHFAMHIAMVLKLFMHYFISGCSA
jgi:hypothetical protein